MTARVTSKLIVSRIRAVQAAGLTVTGVAPDGTVLTLANPAPAASQSSGEDDECRRLFLRDKA